MTATASNIMGTVASDDSFNYYGRFAEAAAYTQQVQQNNQQQNQLNQWGNQAETNAWDQQNQYATNNYYSDKYGQQAGQAAVNTSFGSTVTPGAHTSYDNF